MRAGRRGATVLALSAAILVSTAGAAWAPSHRGYGGSGPGVTRPTVQRTGPWANLTGQQIYARLQDRFEGVKWRFTNITDRFDTVLDRLERWNEACRNDPAITADIEALRATLEEARQKAAGAVNGIPNLPGTYAPGIKDTLRALHRDLKDARLTLAGARGDVGQIVQALRAQCPASATTTTTTTAALTTTTST